MLCQDRVRPSCRSCSYRSSGSCNLCMQHQVHRTPRQHGPCPNLCKSSRVEAPFASSPASAASSPFASGLSEPHLSRPVFAAFACPSICSLLPARSHRILAPAKCCPAWSCISGPRPRSSFEAQNGSPPTEGTVTLDVLPLHSKPACAFSATGSLTAVRKNFIFLAAVVKRYRTHALRVGARV